MPAFSSVRTGPARGRPHAGALRLSAAFAATIVMLALVPALMPAEGRAEALAPYKDGLFAYPATLEASADGAFRRIDYREMRDINGRDAVPERRVRRAYVSLRANRAMRARTVSAGGRAVPVIETGAASEARFAVVFVHGRGGDRRLGQNDWSFGGNFNRLKNLAVRNGGVYVTPSLATFDTAGEGALRAVLADLAERHGAVPVVVACGSMGGIVCWRLARDPIAGARIAGLVVLGGPADAAFPETPAFDAGLPVVLAHGGADGVYAWQDHKAMFDAVRRRVPSYPIRLVVFAGGSHGTPIRMIDWRETLNWLLAGGR